MTAFGSSEAAAGLPGYDFLLQAMGGLMAVTGEPDGRPLKAGTAVVDLVCGLLAANGIQAALVERARTGAGRHVEVSLMDSALTILLNQGTAWVAAGVNGRRRGNRHPSIVPYETYETADREIAIATGNERIFVRLCEALGLPALPPDERFASNEARVAHADEFAAAFEAVLRAAPADTGSRCCARPRSPPGRSTGSTRRSRYAEELGMEPTEEVDGAAADPPAAARRRRAPADPPRAAGARRARRRAPRVAQIGWTWLIEVAAVQQHVDQDRRRLVGRAPSPTSAKSSAAAMFVDAQVTTPQPPSVLADGAVHVAGDHPLDLR